MSGTWRLFESTHSEKELRGYSRTVSEIEWLMLMLVLLYQTVFPADDEASAALAMAMLFFAALIIALHYSVLSRGLTQVQLAVEAVAMIAFITWVLLHTGRLDSPLINLYLLVVVTTALTLGRNATLVATALIAGCYLWLGATARHNTAVHYTAEIAARFGPMLLVAYVTIMLSGDLRRALAGMRALSETDELTGLPNMRSFKSIAERISRQSARYSHPYTVLMVDSDSLKPVNDRYGHAAGNRLLQMTVRCMQSELRDTDVLARYGGDEFVALLPETPAAVAAGVAARIRESIARTPLVIGGSTVQTSVSIGVAEYPGHGQAFQEVLEKADAAMYSSKTGGRNRVTVHGAA